jgi:hypothetical protein
VSYFDGGVPSTLREMTDEDLLAARPELVDIDPVWGQFVDLALSSSPGRGIVLGRQFTRSQARFEVWEMLVLTQVERDIVLKRNGAEGAEGQS